MDRRQFLGASLAPGIHTDEGGQQGRPNFLVLMSDQHSPHVAGCYGDRVVQTPHFDALASQGVLFEHAYCQSPICVPSRMSFLTGQQPSAIRVWSNPDILASDIPTFAHALGAGGYETALIGRMHFQGVDASHGFERLLVGNITPTYAHIPHSLPRDLLVGAGGNSCAAVALAGPGRTAYQAHDEQVAEAAVEYLRQKARQKERPFCAVAGFVLPHAPYICEKSDWDYYLRRVTLPDIPEGYYETLHPAMKVWRKSRGLEGLTRDEVRKARAAYYGLVTHFDRLVGQVTRALRESGLDRDTVVIYVSDHGDMAGEHGMFWKNSFYEGSVGVPLIVSCPARFQPGRRIQQIASLVDIGPTLIDMAGAPKLPDATGRSLLPLLSGGSAADWPNEAFSEFPSTRGVPAMRMIRSGRWKLNHYEGFRPQLFDLENDPHEFCDLGETLEHAEVREKLHRRVLAGWSAALMEEELRRRAANRQVLRDWALRTKPPAPNQWRPPAGSNLFRKEN